MPYEAMELMEKKEKCPLWPVKIKRMERPPGAVAEGYRNPFLIADLVLSTRATREAQ
jgi:hypothetical protein